MTTLRHRAAAAWLTLLFWFVAHAPGLARALRTPGVWGGWAFSPATRRGTLANARRVLGAGPHGRGVPRLARAMIGSFYDAVLEFGDRDGGAPRLESVVGQEHYDAARAPARGTILATAHMGSFEGAMALVARRERRVYVVFRRDPYPVFERLRVRRHERLGVLECPVDDGLPAWMHLRDALRKDAVVLLQADRVLPGQKGVPAPFLGGSLLMPEGIVKLARLTSAPILPVFAPRVAGGVRIVVDEPIHVDPEPPPRGTIDPAQRLLAAAVERAVLAYPDQWLCLHPALLEDQWCPAS
ncbi:MAG: lysophospholipid acyltransferase family protein [Phycisphaerales bacterium]|nr:lysophospholipid acyltransferase family protein [Phycisphaerales bacterium]